MAYQSVSIYQCSLILSYPALCGRKSGVYGFGRVGIIQGRVYPGSADEGMEGFSSRCAFFHECLDHVYIASNETTESRVATDFVIGTWICKLQFQFHFLRMEPRHAVPRHRLLHDEGGQ